MSKNLHKLESALRSVQKILRYTKNEDFESFTQDDMKTDAVLMQFVNLGEKFGTLSADFKSSHPHLPYRDAKDMRNYIAHQYDGVNRVTLWKTITDIIPPLEDQLLKIINDLNR
jgi:uncharacterized protein with HEPN domain